MLKCKRNFSVEKNHFSPRVTEHWHRFPREVLESLSLQIVQKDVVLPSLLEWVSGKMTSRGACQSQPFPDSVIFHCNRHSSSGQTASCLNNALKTVSSLFLKILYSPFLQSSLQCASFLLIVICVTGT